MFLSDDLLDFAAVDVGILLREPVDDFLDTALLGSFAFFHAASLSRFAGQVNKYVVSSSRDRHVRRIACRKPHGGETYFMDQYDLVETGAGQWDVQVRDSVAVVGYIWHTGTADIAWDWADRQVGLSLVERPWSTFADRMRRCTRIVSGGQHLDVSLVAPNRPQI